MAFNWKEYLDLSRYLQGRSGAGFSQEAADRSAVSRAYYSAFCHARNYARDNEGFSPTGTSRDHALVRDHFRKSGRVDIADSLDELRQWRNSCDYYDSASHLSLLVTSAINEAREVLNKLI